ncbi:MAG: phosphatidylcholine/phosphatidylserine synthase [Treponema sp.]|nr:phosphatidylcholine/phosphatidylserine synthase [Treponema sp.]MCL2191431.1 phosphatidylcholine/phosphatidylserine synthase [Treponema sp.]
MRARGQRRKRRKLKHIAVLPSLVTLVNGMCGFTAIFFASRGMGTAWELDLLPETNISFFALAGYMIFLGMVADMLDGHIARISKTTSSFGAQLDSLCDVITFGVAPAFLMLQLVEAYSHQLTFASYVISERVVYLVAIVYVMCAIIRLARFNVESKNDDTHLGFAGLPSPPAAGVIVSIVVFQQDFLPRISRWDALVDGFSVAIIWILPFVTLLAGLLMVTRIPYPHVLNRILSGKKRFSTFLLILFVLPLMIWNIQLTMALGFSVFVLYGVIRWLFVQAFSRKRKGQERERSWERNLGSGI